jgi:putative hemolysin
VGILSGALGGSTLAEDLQPTIAAVPALEPYAEAVSVGIVVLSITYLSLVIGELVPKQLALNNAEGIAAVVARPMNWLSRLASPLVTLLTLSTELVLWLLRIKASDDPPITEDEVRIMLEAGAEAGVFEAAEQQMAAQVFRLADVPISAVMTPYPAITWLDLAAPAAENMAVIHANRHSVYPAFEEEQRNVVGEVALKDLWDQLAAGQPLDLRAALKPAVYIPETTAALQALEFFRRPDLHTAIVIDEHGSIVGLVTALDILEVVIGDLPETESPQIVKRADGSWLVDGTYNIAALETVLEADIFPEAERREYELVSGFVMRRLGRIPKEGDEFSWQGYRFEVMDMDGRRVDKVLVERREAAKQ